MCRRSLDFYFYFLVIELGMWFLVVFFFIFFVCCSKTSLKLAVSRIKVLKNKGEAQLKQTKKDLAQLLESGQDKPARIRVLYRSVLVLSILKVYIGGMI